MEINRESKKRRLNDYLQEDSDNRELINNNNNNNKYHSYTTPAYLGGKKYYYQGTPYGFYYMCISFTLLWFYQNLNMNSYEAAKGMFIILFISYCITAVFCF